MTDAEPTQTKEARARRMAAAAEKAKREERESKLHVVLADAARAGAELKFLASAFQQLREALVEAWQNTDPRDDKGREKLWIATTQLTQVERSLRRTVQSGEVAKKEIEAIRTAGQPRGLLRRLI